MSLRDTIAGSWSGAGELGCNALDLQLRLYEESRADAARRSTGLPNFSLFEAAAVKIAESIRGDDPESDIRAIHSLPPAILARAFGEEWEKLPYSTFSAARDRLLSNDLASLSGSLSSIDVDEWYVRTWMMATQRTRKTRCRRSTYASRILLNERFLRDESKHDWKYVIALLSILCATDPPECLFS